MEFFQLRDELLDSHGLSRIVKGKHGRRKGIKITAEKENN